MRGGASDLVPGAFGPCSFFGACLAFATTAPPSCARARKARRSGGRSKRARRTRERCAWSVSAGRMTAGQHHVRVSGGGFGVDYPNPRGLDAGPPPPPLAGGPEAVYALDPELVPVRDRA